MTRVVGCPYCSCCELMLIVEPDEFKFDRISAFRCADCKREFTTPAVGGLIPGNPSLPLRGPLG